MSTDPGLCATCVNARIVQSRRGSRFWLCSLARVDARFPRYPPLPVVRCGGYARGAPHAAEGTDETPQGGEID